MGGGAQWGRLNCCGSKTREWQDFMSMHMAIGQAFWQYSTSILLFIQSVSLPYISEFVFHVKSICEIEWWASFFSFSSKASLFPLTAWCYTNKSHFAAAARRKWCSGVLVSQIRSLYNILEISQSLVVSTNDLAPQIVSLTSDHGLTFMPFQDNIGKR